MNPVSSVNQRSAVRASLLTMIATRFVLRRCSSDWPCSAHSRPTTPDSSYVGLGSRSCESRPFQYVSNELWIECQCQYMTPNAPDARWL
ncbi:hypothetical protein D3C74_356760 [compost metagenome]